MTETLFEVGLPEAVTDRPLHLTVDPWNDYLTALEFGRVSDGWPEGTRLQVEDTPLDYLLDEPGGTVIGFEIWSFEEFELPDDEPEIWDGPRFDVPRLGLVQASAGEIVLAARAQLQGRPTVDADLFHQAIRAHSAGDVEEALILWESALEAGDMKALFGLGYTLLEAGRPREAYAHLRRYTELTPSNSWAWHWRAQACEALGEIREAIRCYREAVRCEEAGGMETDAALRLVRLLQQTG